MGVQTVADEILEGSGKVMGPQKGGVGSSASMCSCTPFGDPEQHAGEMREGRGRKEDEVVHVGRGGRTVYVVRGGRPKAASMRYPQSEHTISNTDALNQIGSGRTAQARGSKARIGGRFGRPVNHVIVYSLYISCLRINHQQL